MESRKMKISRILKLLKLISKSDESNIVSAEKLFVANRVLTIAYQQVDDGSLQINNLTSYVQALIEFRDDKLDFKYVVLLNPCLPFLTAETIDNFFKEYLSSSFDGMFGVIDKKNYFWNSNGDLITEWYNGLACMNTKFVDSTYEAANCLYGSKLSLIKDGIWMGKAPYTKNNPVIYPVSEEECFDIDYPWQFTRAELLYRSKK